MKDVLVLIDGNSILNRAYYAIPALNDESGRNVNAVYGFVSILLKVLSDYSPTKLAVTFDLHGVNFRKQIYPEYKANRSGMPDDLAAQMPILHELLAKMGVKVVEKPGVEADDIIGTLAKKFGVTSLVVTGDRDMLQLVDGNITVLLTKRGMTDVEKVDETRLKEAYGLTAQQVVEFKALRGDTSDNIPGVRGIGEKTALALLAKYGDLDGVYANVENEKGALKERLIDGKEMAYVSKVLATIVTDADVSCELSECVLPDFSEEVKSAMTALGFRSLISRINFTETKPAPSDFSAECAEVNSAAELHSAIAELSDAAIIAFDMYENALYFAKDETKQYRVAIGEGFLDELNAEAVFGAVSPILSGSAEKIVFDAKALRRRLEGWAKLNNAKFDLALMQYLTEYRAAKTYEELLSSFGIASKYRAAAAFQLKDKLTAKLAANGEEKLYSEVELPLSDLLFRMEQEGVKVDVAALSRLSEQFKQEIAEVSEEIYRAAGEKFNVSSPKQLSHVLFEKLGLKHFKKTSLGYSTGSDVLEKLRGQHEIIDLIIKYRQVTKLYGTYVEGLRPLIRGGLVHTTYNQYLTTTGRLSSSDPNLQNIPIRGEQKREIRKIFVSKYGKFVGADYSQIELRLLAAFSGDENLLAAFAEDRDVHKKVASEILGIPEQLVNADMRRMAKAVNFGIIYGISGYGLSENVGISVKKAQQYIELYFSRFPRIRAYLASSVEQARQNGYVSTLTGRRRYLPEINSQNANVRSFGERAAMNMPLQGSAADIMKIAMLKVDSAMQKENLKSKIVMQVHDELIVDCYPEEVSKVKEILKREMESALQLSCKLTVDLEEGETLYEA